MTASHVLEYVKLLLIGVFAIMLTACVVHRQSAGLVRVEDLDRSVKVISGPKISIMDVWEPPHGPGIVQEAIVSFIVQEDGTVTDFKVVNATGQKIKDVVVAKRSSWRFQPATRHGVPARFRLTVPVIADLSDSTSEKQ